MPSTERAETSMADLLACPFCGSHDISSGESLVSASSGYGKQTGCNACGALGPIASITDEQVMGTEGDELADAAWNRRSGAGDAAVETGWRPIETAPKDGAEVLAWREDCGVMMARYTCANNLSTITDKERDELDEESLFQEDWFGGDSELGGCRLEGSEVPTHWMPLPSAPGSSSIKQEMPEALSEEQKDAARYRWLRERNWFDSELCVLREPKKVLTRGAGLGADCPSRDRLDAFIDAAIERSVIAQEGKGERNA